MSDAIYLLDGYGLIYRSYFAFINKPLTDNDGNNVSAIHGFFRQLISLRTQYDAERIIVAFDPVGPTFRHDRYPQYKANRDTTPEDLHAQVPLIEEALGYLGIPVVCMDGFEADDIIGSAAQYCRENRLSCRIVSADKDMMQLIGGPVTMLKPEKGVGFRVFDSDTVLEKKGVRPEQFIDYLALVGDSSDNIPGVLGIGEKTASELLGRWESMDNLYENLDKMTKGRMSKLSEGRTSAYLSRDLVTIRCDLDVADIINGPAETIRDMPRVKTFFRERGMRVIAEDINVFSSNSDLIERSPEPRQAARSPQVNYSAILTQEQLTHWKEKILQAGIVSLDTETDGIDPMQASLIGVSFSIDSNEAAYLPLKRPDGPCLDHEVVIDWLTEVFCVNPVKIIGQNFKFDVKVLRRSKVPVRHAWFDTMIAAWVLDSSSKVGMDALAERYLGIDTMKFNDVVPRGASFADVPLNEALEYAAEDALITLRLYECLGPLLEEDERRKKIFWNIEMPLQPVLIDMEIEGIGLDVLELADYAIELNQDITDLMKTIYALCGKEFNIASPKQLQQVLFEERKLTPGKRTKTGYSTDNSVLSGLVKEDPLPEKILLYRSLTKLKSTYVDALPKVIHPEDGRIHTSYSQTGAATGRLSSNNPNLQNIPIRDENGRRIRRAFKSRPGFQFISADYSQIELVILADMSGDEALSSAFRSSLDVHAQTAALLYGVATADVTPKQRRMAKAVNFGVMYGMSPFRLANELRISNKEAKHFIDTYFITYGGIRAFVDKTVELAEQDGGVRTMDGRFRPLPGINSHNRVEKVAAERAAVNSRIQGTAADIMKMAMLAVHNVLKERRLKAKILLQVHDELLIEVPSSEVQIVADLVKSTMEGVSRLSVPLRAEVEIGSSWGDIH